MSMSRKRYDRDDGTEVKRRKILQIFVLLLCVYGMWVIACSSQIHQMPSVAKEDLSAYYYLRDDSSLSEKDYEKIFRQTGVAKPGIDTLIANKEMYQLRVIQERFFESPKLITERANIFCHREWIEEPTETRAKFVVEDGDIIITLSSYLGGWRYGHCGLILDAEKGVVLEAITYGEPSCQMSIRHWSEYPTFVILRPKNVSPEAKRAVIDYCYSELMDIRYDLLSFKTKRARGPISRTHCSHLIWYAYNRVGCDLDSDHSPIVTPYDIANDDDLEVVQVYGMRLEDGN